jgi:hypothetical protein
MDFPSDSTLPLSVQLTDSQLVYLHICHHQRPFPHLAQGPLIPHVDDLGIRKQEFQAPASF